MGNTTAWRLIQGCYWLALGAWFGALVMLAISAAATFHTMSSLPTPMGMIPPEIEASVNNPAEFMAGMIVGQAIDWLRVMQWICAVVLVIAVASHLSAFRGRMPRSGLAQWSNTLRVMLLAAVVLILSVDSFYVSPGIKAARIARYEADRLDNQVKAATESFDKYHGLSVRLVRMQVVMLGVAALASAYALHGEPHPT